MSAFRAVFLTVVTVTLLFECTHAGPISRFAIALRNTNSKIPRTIRAPFRNTEMMTARGFGKRSYTKENDFVGTSGQWSFGKPDSAKFLDDSLPDTDLIEQYINDQPGSISIEWFANEIASNPQLIKHILHRFVDTDKDGFLSQHEILSTNPSLTQETNELY